MCCARGTHTKKAQPNGVGWLPVCLIKNSFGSYVQCITNMPHENLIIISELSLSIRSTADNTSISNANIPILLGECVIHTSTKERKWNENNSERARPARRESGDGGKANSKTDSNEQRERAVCAFFSARWLLLLLLLLGGGHGAIPPTGLLRACFSYCCCCF